MEKKKLFIKMLIVFASFFMLFILSNSNVFAASSKSFTLKSGDKVIFDDFPDGFVYNDYLIFYDKKNDTYRVFNYDSSKVHLGLRKTTLENGKVNCVLKAFWPDGSCDKIDGVYPGHYSLSSSTYQGKFPYPVSDFSSSSFDFAEDIGDNYLCTTDIYLMEVDDNGEYCLNKDKKVFLAAKEPSQLTTIAKSMDFLAVIKEVLGILPTILAVLIGLLSLRKAIQLMLKMLHQA